MGHSSDDSDNIQNSFLNNGASSFLKKPANFIDMELCLNQTFKEMKRYVE